MSQLIPAGYKQTEVGVIPEDWEIKKLGEIANFASGTTPRRENHERYFQNGSIFWVKTMDLNNSEIHETSEKITEIALKETSSLKVFPVETVLIAMYGGFNQIGRTGILKIKACVNQALTAVQPDKNILMPLFLINFLNYRIDSWKDVATSSRKDPNITSKDIKDFFTVIPPIPEQAAIATALSDVDALISELNSEIAKKRLIKQGAMQELLSGKKRLAGFYGEWEVKKLGDVLKVKHGKSQKEVEDINGQYPILGTGGLMGYTNCFLYDKPSVLIGRKGTIDKPQFMNSPFWTVDTLFYTEIFNDYLPKYLYYNFLQIDWYSYNEASGVPSLNAKTIENISILFPPTKEEQTAIAQILSDMDSDILALETQRNKTKAIKQGMMQNLLTGKIRLI